MRNKLVLSVTPTLLMVFLFLSCDKEEIDIFPLKQADLLSNDVYDVYSSTLDSLNSYGRIIVDQETTRSTHFERYGPPFEYLVNTFPNFDTTIVSAYHKKSETSVILGDNFTNKSRQILLISSEEANYYLGPEPESSRIETLFNKYKAEKHILRFTQVGFNEEKTQAMFELQMHIDYLTSIGFFVYLEKLNGEWNALAIGITYQG